MEKFLSLLLILSLLSCTPRTTVNIPDAEMEIAGFDVMDSLLLEDDKGELVMSVYECPVHESNTHGQIFTLVLHHQQKSDCGVYKLVQTYIEASNGDEHCYIEYGRWDNEDDIITLRPFSGEEELYFGMRHTQRELVMLDRGGRPVNNGFNYTLLRK